MASEGITGNFRVRALRPAFEDARRICPHTKDRMELREHALKLRYWPTPHPVAQDGQVLDLDWSWVMALRNLRIGELRIDDLIGGNDNLRIIFFEGDHAVRDPLPMMWILRVMQKKRNDFSAHDLSIAKMRRLIVLERFYADKIN